MTLPSLHFTEKAKMEFCFSKAIVQYFKFFIFSRNCYSVYRVENCKQCSNMFPGSLQH